MQGQDITRRKLHFRRIALRMLLVIYDAIAINISFILTLYLRFYVAREMHAGSVRFFELFTHYTPFYTLFCIIVFACFKLYNGMWKYAGFHDMNRIIAANILCVIGHIIGTLLFMYRMPRSFYLIGGVIQLCLVGFVRFSFKILEIERKLIFGSKKSSSIRAIIIGIDGSTRNLIRRLEHEKFIHPVCIMDYELFGMGTILDGIPVVSGIDKLEEIIKKYDVNYIIFTSHSMLGDLRKQIRNTCLKLNVEVEDYYDDLSGDAALISYGELIDKINGKIQIICNNMIVKEEDIPIYKNDINNYKIVGMSASSDTIYIELNDKIDKKLNLNEEWIKEQELKTGEKISFF